MANVVCAGFDSAKIGNEWGQSKGQGQGRPHLKALHALESMRKKFNYRRHSKGNCCELPCLRHHPESTSRDRPLFVLLPPQMGGTATPRLHDYFDQNDLQRMANTELSGDQSSEGG